MGSSVRSERKKNGFSSIFKSCFNFLSKIARVVENQSDFCQKWLEISPVPKMQALSKNYSSPSWIFSSSTFHPLHLHDLCLFRVVAVLVDDPLENQVDGLFNHTQRDNEPLAGLNRFPETI